MVTAHVDPAVVTCHIINPVEDGLGLLGIDEVVNSDTLWISVGPPFSAFVVSWSYSDLQRQVSARTGTPGNVPFQRALTLEADLNEASFIDATARALRSGRFLMVIVGDGIQEGVEAIAELVNRNAASAFQLAMVEAALYDVGDGAVAIQPRVLARTRLIERVGDCGQRDEHAV